MSQQQISLIYNDDCNNIDVRRVNCSCTSRCQRSCTCSCHCNRNNQHHHHQGSSRRGPQGPQGDKGDKGEKGEKGIDGLQGPTGSFGGVVQEDILPDTAKTVNIGKVGLEFNEIHCKSLFAEKDSIYLGNAKISAVNNTISLPSGSTIGGITPG